ncbi:sensor histidine kinase [Krasilnikoviella flava]|uniref:histidine kinase n=1 Tax=Krasilnikoviella flava TaxID=526729 RepID=A0A1T5LE61_9MICO|nr:sensor histidine kinase [Krasilnikoviella flava]SKC74347.1 Histidine kinase-, DNA gyrase B-, and HSP90-like ATPase [Krasilnikoviella flava]
MGDPRVRERVLAAGWLVSLGVAAVAVLQWRAYVREVEQRAEDAERTRDEVARRRAVEERLRIARELHDSLTHSISVIKVQAGVAAHLARKRGEEPPPALLAIQEASTDAARELRSTLDVLRRDGEPNGNGLDRLTTLVERAEGAGVPVAVTVTGARRTLPAAVDEAAYRVVQEALTNVARHGGPGATATVRVALAARELVLEVDDDGRGSAGPPQAGHGLTGMRERVDALGGTLRAAPRDAGGFGVRVTLPLPGARPAADGAADLGTRPAADGAAAHDAAPDTVARS